MKKYVITISRQFGSMGRSIAQELSERLAVPFYDRDIVEETAKRMALPVSVISDEEEMSKSIYFKRKYPLGMGIPNLQDEIFLVQKNVILDMVERESCIIVGRCADSILKDFENKLCIYIYAPYEARYENCITQLGMDEATAERMIREVDKSREQYHRRYCQGYVNEMSNKDILLNSSFFGISGTAEVLEKIARRHFGSNAEQDEDFH